MHGHGRTGNNIFFLNAHILCMYDVTPVSTHLCAWMLLFKGKTIC